MLHLINNNNIINFIKTFCNNNQHFYLIVDDLILSLDKINNIIIIDEVQHSGRAL